MSKENKIFDDCCKLLDEEKDWIKCPYCGECYYQEGYTTSTLMWCPTVIKNGKVISEDLNTSTTHCHCLACDKDFVYDNKGNVSKCEQPAKPVNVEFNNEDLTINADSGVETVKQTLESKNYITDTKTITLENTMEKTNRQVELEEYIKDIITTTDLVKSRIHFDKLEFKSESGEDYEGPDYYILSLTGGLNGRGQFLFYLEDVKKIVERLMCRFSDVWLIDWENDCPDDVFYLEIGVRL